MVCVPSKKCAQMQYWRKTGSNDVYSWVSVAWTSDSSLSVGVSSEDFFSSSAVIYFLGLPDFLISSTSSSEFLFQL